MFFNKEFVLSDLDSSDEYTLVGMRSILYTQSYHHEVKEKHYDGAFPSYIKGVVFENIDKWINMAEWDIGGEISIDIFIAKTHLSNINKAKVKEHIDALREIFELRERFDEHSQNPEKKLSEESEEDEI